MIRGRDRDYGSREPGPPAGTISDSRDRPPQARTPPGREVDTGRLLHRRLRPGDRHRQRVQGTGRLPADQPAADLRRRPRRGRLHMAGRASDRRAPLQRARRPAGVLNRIWKPVGGTEDSTVSSRPPSTGRRRHDARRKPRDRGAYFTPVKTVWWPGGCRKPCDDARNPGNFLGKCGMDNCMTGPDRRAIMNCDLRV